MAVDSTTTPSETPIAVVGPGRMGIGIAQVFATAGYDVSILDTKDRTANQWDDKQNFVTETIQSNLKLLEEEDVFDGSEGNVLEKIDITRSFEDGLEDAAWVFEALPESPELKRDFFENAEPHLSEDTVVASTTSSISIDTLADAFDEPGRLLIAHWWNPPFIVPLVEVVRSDGTEETVVSATVDLLESIGKEPVVCEDHPGFLGSRVQAAAMNEAIRAYEDGVADPADVDRALKSGFGFRLPVLGVIEHVDIGGVDVLHGVNEYLTDQLGERFETQRASRKVAADELGPKTGSGFYEYDSADAEELKREKYRGMIAIHRAVYGGPPGDVTHTDND
ncbi:3-hydroxyacyl-CoA dehydrogenase [Natrialba swarupiae]|nr:3-hydroxyacyl-CoA dehydrogenase [Natrialba swarupiae]